MIASISTQLFVYETLLREHLACVAEAGFSALELWCGKPHLEFDDDATVDRLGDWLHETGLAVATLHLPFYNRFGSEDFHFVGLADTRAAVRAEMGDYVRHLLDLCPAWQTRYAVLHLQSEQTFDEENLKLFAEEMQWLEPYCQERGVKLLLENIMTPSTHAAKLVELCAQYPETFGICVDLGHANVEGGITEQIVAAGEWLVAVHAHDNQGKSDQHQAPGEGTIDWLATMQTLAAHAPNLQYFTFELSPPVIGQPTPIAEYMTILCKLKNFWNRFEERK